LERRHVFETAGRLAWPEIREESTFLPGTRLDDPPRVLTSFLALLVLSGVALYIMTPEERERLLHGTVAFTRVVLNAAAQRSEHGEPFQDFLRKRTRWPFVTPAIVLLNTLVFLMMLVAPGAFSDPQTLIAWGGNFAPRTTNGEWWRLFAATFVHTGFVHLCASILGLIPLGFILERAVGRLAFANVYIAAGILASVVSLWNTSTLNVSVGASGAIFGVYGLLVASVLCGIVSRPKVTIPLITIKRTAAAAAVFFLYNFATDQLGTTSELVGMATGFAGGLMLARDVAREAPPVGRTAVVFAMTFLIAVVGAVPLRGRADVRPEIAHVVAVEERTAEAYDTAVTKFTMRRINTDELVTLINRTILPDLRNAHQRLRGVTGVSEEQMPLVTAAEEYLRLRQRSWQRRVEALGRSNMDMLRDAELTERAALEAFRRMKSIG